MKTPGPYEAVVLADSIAQGVRLTTLCCTFPRIVLAEFNTHRVFSRNSASSRAIPVKKRIEQIRANPYVPLSFGKNKRGMQAKAEEVAQAEQAHKSWLDARNAACDYASYLADIGLHKQWANRLIEPFAWHTVIVSATEWDNFWALRISEYAQPEIREVAEAMKAAMDASTPEKLSSGDWHCPLTTGRDLDEEIVRISKSKFANTKTADGRRQVVGFAQKTLVELSVSRCAAISYERHMDHDIDKDLARYEKLHSAGHMSPFEHAAKVGSEKELVDRGLIIEARGETIHCWPKFIGNFRAPWIQHRKMLPGEAVFGSGDV